MCQPATGKIESSESNRVHLRILIADDQPRVRQSLEALLTALGWSTPRPTEYPIEIVGEAGDGQQVIEQVETLQPDVVVLDLPTHGPTHATALPGLVLDGLVAIRTLKRRWPKIRIVVLTMYATDRAAVLLAGADAFLLKGCPTGELLDAVMPAGFANVFVKRKEKEGDI